jgi:AcrR family transcriptional regulator
MMTDPGAGTLTPKGERTRARILEAALRLFAREGYEATTLRAIAAEAGCSLGLAYRYFAAKEDLVLALYLRLAHDLDDVVRALPPAPLAERFTATMRAKLDLLTPHRAALAALFGAALDRDSALAVLGGATAGVRATVERAFVLAVAGATDAPGGARNLMLARVLYGLHLILVLAWLQDRSPDARATRDLLLLVRDAVALAVPLLDTTPAVETLERLARALEPFVGTGEPTR